MPVSPTAEVRVNTPDHHAWLKLDTQRRADLNRCAYAICEFRDGSACALPLLKARQTIAAAFRITAEIHPTLTAERVAELDAIDPEEFC